MPTTTPNDPQRSTVLTLSTDAPLVAPQGFVRAPRGSRVYRSLILSAEECPPESGAFVGVVHDTARLGWEWRSDAASSHTAALALAQARAVAIREGLRHGGQTLDTYAPEERHADLMSAALEIVIE